VAIQVEALYRAELNNLLLAAGRDGSTLTMPLQIDVASGDVRYLKINGKVQRLTQGDMDIADTRGLLSIMV
jgi:hypothetical protein